MADASQRVWPFYGAAAAMSAGFAAIAAAAPVVQHTQGMSDRSLSVAGALASTGAIVGAFAVGKRALSRRSLVMGLLALSASGALGAGLVLRGATLSPLVRLADGLALGACLVACETLLLFTVEVPRRARALALYSLSTALGWAVGPLVAARLVDVEPAGAWPFLLATLAGIVAVGVVVSGGSATPADDPGPGAGPSSGAASSADATAAADPPVSLAAVWRRNLVPCFTTLHFGAFQATLLVVFPLHLLQAGAGPDAAVAVVGAFAAGACVFTLPNTWLGQRLRTAGVMATLCVLGGVAVVGVGQLPLVGPFGGLLRTSLAFTVGGTLATLSPLSLLMQAQTNTVVTLARANALYNAHYAVGMLVGPLLLLVIVDQLATPTLVTTMGALWLIHAVFVLRAAPTAASLVTGSAPLPAPVSVPAPALESP